MDGSGPVGAPTTTCWSTLCFLHFDFWILCSDYLPRGDAGSKHFASLHPVVYKHFKNIPSKERSFWQPTTGMDVGIVGTAQRGKRFYRDRSRKGSRPVADPMEGCGKRPRYFLQARGLDAFVASDLALMQCFIRFGGGRCTKFNSYPGIRIPRYQ
eukprot:SAG11_NODE_6968_length_1217_cov_1.754919_1_plen_155_part_00